MIFFKLSFLKYMYFETRYLEQTVIDVSFWHVIYINLSIYISCISNYNCDYTSLVTA